MEVSIDKAYKLIAHILEAGLVPNLEGSPGLGKSDLIRQIADDFNLELIDFRLAQADPTDLIGIMMINKETGRSDYAPPATFPLITDELPKGKNGWLLFFDEANSASQAVQSSTYKIVLDRMVGQTPLHPNVAIAIAGNLMTDRAIVNRLSTAMQSRLIHLTLNVNHKLWLDWADKNNIDFRIKAFIRFRPELLHKFDPQHSDKTFPCPRTWEFLSKLIKTISQVNETVIPLIAGTIGEGAGLEFTEFAKIYMQLPDISKIIAAPDKISIPEEPSTLYAISSLITKNIDENNIDKLMIYIERMPIEFQVITLHNKIKNKPELVENPVVDAWVSKNAKELM